jgi:hypothetical protein
LNERIAGLEGQIHGTGEERHMTYAMAYKIMPVNFLLATMQQPHVLTRLTVVRYCLRKIASLLLAKHSA